MTSKAGTLRKRPLVFGVIASAVLAGGLTFAAYVHDFDLETALQIEGGLSACIFALLFLCFYGLCLGLPIAMAARWLPINRWVADGLGLAAFCAIGGFFNSSPILTLDHWLTGAGLALVFASSCIAIAFGFSRLTRAR